MQDEKKPSVFHPALSSRLNPPWRVLIYSIPFLNLERNTDWKQSRKTVTASQDVSEHTLFQ